MRSLWLVVTVVLFSSIGFSKTLIVSDIDDTIKIAHVRDPKDVIWYSYVTTSAFKGMAGLYTEVLSEDPDSEVIYVTNANDFLMYQSHTKFVKRNNFPDGKIFFKSAGDDDHKYDTIKKYLEENSFDKLIMLGDNGQQDISFYDRITKEFKDKMQIRTFIRKVYGAPTIVLPFAEGQIPFISPLEILADLEKNNLISEDKYFVLANGMAVEMLQEKDVSSYQPQYFPKWLNCKDMEFFIYPELMSLEISKAYEKMSEICQ